MSYFSNEIDDKVVELLKGGGVGLLPTDTIYGLSALAFNEQAVERIHKLKGRDGSKPFIVLISDIEQLEELGLKSSGADLVKKYWPGPLSVEFDASKALLWLHRGQNYFAVRMPDDNNLRSLIRKTGPIVSTSANLHGQKPASSAEEAKQYFKNKLDFYVDMGKLEGQPSTLVKFENSRLIVLRKGACDINL